MTISGVMHSITSSYNRRHIWILGSRLTSHDGPYTRYFPGASEKPFFEVKSVIPFSVPLVVSIGYDL